MGFPYGKIGDPGVIHEDAELLRDSLLQIFNTQRGERRLLPEFGSDIPALLFEPNDPFLYQQIEAEVRRAIALWEPRLQVNYIMFNASSNDLNTGQLFMEISVKALNNPRILTFTLPLSSTGQFGV